MVEDSDSFVKIAEHIIRLIESCSKETSTSTELTSNVKDMLNSLMMPIDNSLRSFSNLNSHYYFEVVSDHFSAHLSN